MENDLDRAYKEWSRYWEAWMLSDAPITVNKEKHLGRGCPARVIEIPPKPPRSADVPPDIAFLTKFLGRLREVARLQHRDTDYAAALVAKVIRQAEMYMRRFGTPLPHPTGDELKALELHAAKTLRERQDFHDKIAKEKWRARLTQRLGVHRTVSQAVKRTPDAVIRTMRKNKEAQPVLEQEKVFELLDEYWQQIRMKEEEDLEAWSREFVEPLPQHPHFVLPRLEPQMIKVRLAAMKPHTSKGPDAWSVLELRALPDEAVVQLTMLLAAIEAFGTWPEAMREIHVVPLQKEIDPTPDGVASIVYRLWAAVRFQHLVPWMQQWCPEQLTAYRPHRDVQTHNLRRACLLEQDEIRGAETVRASFDLQKAFDFVPHRAVCIVAQKFGFPPSLLELVVGENVYSECQMED